jgi:nucleotide-binding universal stress UspA family protein
MLREGDPPAAILDQAGSVGADLIAMMGLTDAGNGPMGRPPCRLLIAMGTEGLSGLNRLLLGSTAERVIASAPCPVLTVRSEAP